MTPMYPSAFMGPTPLRRLKERRAAISALCNALEAYLSLDVDADMEMFEKMKTAPSVPSVTPEMLANAQIELERMETTREQMDAMRDKLPDDLGVMLSPLESMLLPGLDNQRRYVKSLQDRLDGKTFSVLCECGALLLADGTTSRYPASDVFSGTKEECATKAAECGWTVNGEDQTCPECAKV